MVIRSLFLLLVLCSQVFSGTRDPHTPDEKHINYAKDFNYIGRLCGENNDNKIFCASGVAINDYTILTAAHVIHDAKFSYIYINHKKISISKMIINKHFKLYSFGTADIAICHCDEPIGLKFYPELYNNNDEVGKVCSISGYGITGTFNSGAVISDKIRRAGSNTIDTIYADLLVCTPSKKTDADYTSLEFIIAPGDSGGGLFIGNKLAGINSCVMASKRIPTSSYGDESCHTRVSIFADWIRENKKNKP